MVPGAGNLTAVDPRSEADGLGHTGVARAARGGGLGRRSDGERRATASQRRTVAARPSGDVGPEIKESPGDLSGLGGCGMTTR